MKSFCDMQIQEVLEKVKLLKEKSEKSELKAADLEAKNEKLQQEIRQAKPNKEINIGKPGDTPKGS